MVSQALSNCKPYLKMKILVLPMASQGFSDIKWDMDSKCFGAIKPHIKAKGYSYISS